ncbi:MAG TPA: DMT family transporter [Chitinophagaceae bacterium]|nr:DMT family transporter [Chitinophagaceae bacterium]
MLLAALGFSVMGGAAKILKGSFNAGQLVFYRNLVGLVVLMISFARRPPVSHGGKFRWLIFRGIMGTVALYTLIYCILHIPLGTAMTYNLTSALFISVFSFFLFGEYHGKRVAGAVLLGFIGMLLVYKPAMHFPWYYHLAGLLSGIFSAIAYITVGKLNRYYDARVIVAAFIITGVLMPGISMIVQQAGGFTPDEIFLVAFKIPHGIEWLWLIVLGLAALFGQYFVTRAYGAEKAAVVSPISYANIVFSVFIGMALGDAFPDWMSLGGIGCIICSGIIISRFKKGQ